MDLSVVVPTFRKPELLERTLGALCEQVAQGSDPVEVLVVDDGSADGRTPAVIASFAGRCALRPVGGDRNEGRARARNRGWRAARGRSVLFLDDDIVLRPGALAAHVRAQRDLPAVWCGDVVTAPEIVDSVLFDYLDSRGVAKTAPGARVPARYLLTQNVSIPREALERVGGFDEAFEGYGFEDMEIGFRLEDRVGLGFFHLAGAEGVHVHHHTLDDYLEKKRECGRSTLPRLAGLHPGRVAEMGLDVLDLDVRPASPARALLRMGLRGSWALAAPSAALGLLRTGGRGIPRALRHRLLDYLVLSAYAEGLRSRD